MIDAGNAAIEVVGFAVEAIVEAASAQPVRKRRRRRSRVLGLLAFVALLVMIAAALIYLADVVRGQCSLTSQRNSASQLPLGANHR